MLGKQADCKSNREVFAKEYVILVEAEQNQPLCTYVYISLDMCKELLHFYSCSPRFLWQKVSTTMKKKTCKADFSKWQRVIFIKCRQAHWQRVNGPYQHFLALRIPRFPVCWLFLMFHFLTLFWLADVIPGTSGSGVGHSDQAQCVYQAHPVGNFWEPVRSKYWKPFSFSFYRGGNRGTKKRNGIVMVTNRCICNKAWVSSHGLSAL